MAQNSGFFNAAVSNNIPDRVYQAEEFASYFASFIGNGVFPDPANGLQVSQQATPNMSVFVRPGEGWINGYWYSNTENLQFAIGVADSVAHRIDAIVLRLDLTTRKVSTELKKGTPSANPAAPSAERTNLVYELVLAHIRISAGATSITASAITDKRQDADLCGIVAGVVDQIDATGLFDQYGAAFIEWFDAVKGQLTTDQAGNLLKLINDLSVRVDGLWNLFWQKMYPVGAIYLSFSETSPAYLFGGTWLQIKDKVLRAADSTSVGGVDTVTLTVAQMPSHNHGFEQFQDQGGTAYGGIGTTASTSSPSINTWTIKETGGSSSHSNLPAFQNCYTWRRTA